MKFISNTIRFFFLLISFFSLCVIGAILYGMATEHHFPDQLKLSEELEFVKAISDTTFEFISWNIGYVGLGEESDFFYDGGEDVFTSKDLIQKNMDGVIDFIQDHSYVDFFLLQEVDSMSWRSNKLNFFQKIENSWRYNYALNYASSFVPIPIFNPLGPVYGGLCSMTHFPVIDAFRYDLRTESAWPQRLFFLKRCFLTQRIPLLEKELIVINIHNSAYDKSGIKKNKEMQHILNYAEREFEKGNYVVIGGDWNQSPPSYSNNTIPELYKNSSFTNDDIPQDWRWVADVNTPTNRKLNMPYTKGVSYTSVIDHYLISPNVSVDSIAVVDMQFKYSDHQPVYLKVTLDKGSNQSKPAQ